MTTEMSAETRHHRDDYHRDDYHRDDSHRDDYRFGDTTAAHEVRP